MSNCCAFKPPCGAELSSNFFDDKIMKELARLSLVIYIETNNAQEPHYTTSTHEGDEGHENGECGPEQSSATPAAGRVGGASGVAGSKSDRRRLRGTGTATKERGGKCAKTRQGRGGKNPDLFAQLRAFHGVGQSHSTTRTTGEDEEPNTPS